MSRTLTIDGVRIADDAPCYVIAEVGHNHGGSLETALEMVSAAAECGAHAVKFQKRENATLYSRALLEKPYENENSYGATYGAHRAVLEFGYTEFNHLLSAASSVYVSCFATAFDEPSADFIAQLGMPAIKIASGGVTDVPLLTHVAKLKIPIILSTGGATIKHVDRAVETIVKHHQDLAILHCTASYPVRNYEELNLKVIATYRQRYPYVIGWSGHDPGIAMSVAAYSLGARIVEKHFTTNRSNKGTDHAFSLEPVGLRKLVRDLERTRLALGDGLKRYYKSEVAPISKMRRRPLPDGTMQITGEMDAID